MRKFAGKPDFTEQRVQAESMNLLQWMQYADLEGFSITSRERLVCRGESALSKDAAVVRQGWRIQ